MPSTCVVFYCTNRYDAAIDRSFHGIMSNSTAGSLKMKRSPIHLLTASNFEYEESPHPTAKIRVPGLSHESFDRDWNPKITSIMMISVIARSAVFQRPLPSGLPNGGSGTNEAADQEEKKIFLDYPKVSSDFYTFMSSSEFVMSPAMYDNSLPKSPVDMEFTLGYVGNSSIANRCEYYSCERSDGAEKEESRSGRSPLWTNTYQIVCVDKSTRKAAKLPDWFKEKYKGRGCMDKGLIFRPFNRPAHTFALPTTVLWTDTDNYKHVNFSTYARWAVNALHAALLAQSKITESSPRDGSATTSGEAETLAAAAAEASPALRGITKEIVARGLHKMHISYLRECLEGERVETHVWQEPGGERELVWFSVVKDGEDICQIKMWYFPADSEKP